MAEARISIRRRLLAFLISSLLLMVAGAATISYWVASKSANDAYDRSLLDPAIDIANNLVVGAAGAQLNLPQKAIEALVFDQVDRIIYQVRSADGRIVDGVADLPQAPDLAVGQHLFFDTRHQGDPMRIAALRAPNGMVVQVGETLHKRNRLVGEILAAELVPALVIAVVAIVLASLGVTRALVPLEQLRAGLMSRSPHDLRPLPDAAVPVEIAPLVEGFNRLLDQLRDASRMQHRFLGNAAHQLRTPLAGLQMHLELLLRGTLPEDVRAELERMHSATVRASRLASQLLALAKAESAPDHVRDLEIVDLRTVADAAARDWAPTAHAQEIDLGFALDRAEVLADPLLLPELIDNLIDNALRYTPAGGAVTVHTGCDDDGPYLSVEDTGPGIAETERTKVVERFYRIPGTRGDGSGLGLAIVQEVVDRHRGKLEIGACAGGRGTRIRVTFPAGPSAGQPA
jgi:two-component system, OmpR family, sensor histidine kinase TctE